MKIIMVLLAIFWIVLGVLLLMLTDTVKEVFRNLLKRKNIKTLSIASLVIGVVLILGSSLVSVPWIAIALGILGLLKGLFFMFGPEKKTTALIDWWLKATNNIYRSWGIVSFLLGVLLLLIL